MKGAEDGVFFTTKKDGDAKDFGNSLISANIPIELLNLDDDLGDELHLRIPTDKRGQSVDVSKFLNKESKCPNCGLIRHENNPNHAPKGDSKGGQFTKGDGGSGSGDDKKDTPKAVSKGAETELNMISSELQLKQDRINNLVNSFNDEPNLHDTASTLESPIMDQWSLDTNMVKNKTLNEFNNALDIGDYAISDKIFIDSIKDEKRFNVFKEREEEIHAYNKSLQIKADNAKELFRFTDQGELDSYLEPNAQFGVSKYSVGKNADYKCLTVEKQNKFFSTSNDVHITYPADEIRDGSKAVNYTQFPRTQNRDVKEDINSTKHSSYATETEVRIKSDTKIPVGKLKITFTEYMSLETKDKMTKKYNSLGELTFTNASRDFIDN